jgi:hypothetical protein
MAIKLSYKGCELQFERPPTPEQVLRAYEAARARAASQPLSYAQEWLWLLDQAAPGSPAYHLPFVVRLEGAFDTEAFTRSVREVVRRHEVLRTSVPAIDGRATARLHPVESVPVTITDLSGVPAESREEEARRLVAARLREPFDLAAGPIMRVDVVRLGPAEHVLALVVHHIASDAWSMGILAREISTLYAAAAAGRESPLPPLPMQYSEHAQWQRNRLHGKTLDTLIDYWRRHLQGAPACLDMPTLGPRPAVQRFDGARRAFAWPAGLAGDLTAFSRDAGVTAHMALLGAFVALLHHWTGQNDIVVGTPMAGRARLEAEPLIGCFINTLPIRIDASGNPRFSTLLARVREAALGAAAHQALPFGQLVRALAPERSASYTPFYQVIFDVNNAPPPRTVELPGLTMKPLGGDPLATAKLDLVVDIWHTSTGLAGAFEYAAALFDDAVMAQLACQFEALVRAAIAQPDARLSALALLSDVDAPWRRLDDREHDSHGYRRLLTIQPRAVRHSATRS